MLLRRAAHNQAAPAVHIMHDTWSVRYQICKQFLRARQVVFWRGGAVQRRFAGGLQRRESHLAVHDMQLYVGSAQSPDVAVRHIGEQSALPVVLHDLACPCSTSSCNTGLSPSRDTELCATQYTAVCSAMC